MPERHHVEEDPFFRATMLAFAVLMPVLAIVLYVVTAIQPPVSGPKPRRAYWDADALYPDTHPAYRTLDPSDRSDGGGAGGDGDTGFGILDVCQCLPSDPAQHRAVVHAAGDCVQCQTRPHVRRGGDAGIRGGGSGVVAVPMLL